MNRRLTNHQLESNQPDQCSTDFTICAPNQGPSGSVYFGPFPPSTLSLVMADFLLDDVFEISAVDPDGKKFDRVSRIQAKSDNFDMSLLLDINIELYPIHKGQKFTLALTKSIAVDASGAPVGADAAWRLEAGSTIADKYEYVMYGRVFKFEDVSSSRM